MIHQEQQPADGEPRDHRPAAKARGQVTCHCRSEQSPELVHGQAEGAADRRPGNAEDSVWKAEAYEGDEGDAEQHASGLRGRSGNNGPPRWRPWRPHLC